ncbi:MAG: class I SAM-dependent RNA methyltransferase [Bryobacteraceae bacterium]
MAASTQQESAREQAIVTIEKLVYGGDGLARSNGQVVLVPFVLPGERVAIAAERANAGLLRGSLLQVLEPAPERITPRCEYFATCGGCHYQQIEYSHQLEQKRAILHETLRRIAGVADRMDTPIVSGHPWHYRNRIQLHFNGREMGFRQRGSHDLRAIAHCEISSPLLNDAISKLRTAIRQPQWPEFLRSLELFTNETDLQLTVTDSSQPVAARFFDWCRSFLPSFAPGAIDYNAAGFTFRVSGGSFFQVNRFLMDALVEEVLWQASGGYAVDLYAGAGLFSLPMARRFERVDAIERGGPGFRDLEWNARQASGDLSAVKDSAEKFLAACGESPDLVIADPPRAGLGRTVVHDLLRIQPRRITLVSCDISTLARDLRKLLPAYRIERLTLVDLFPQTYHFEAVAHLERSV